MINSLSNSRNKNNKKRSKRNRRRTNPRSKSKKIRLRSSCLTYPRWSTVPSLTLSHHPLALLNRHVKCLSQRRKTRKRQKKMRPRLMQYAKSPWCPSQPSSPSMWESTKTKMWLWHSMSLASSLLLKRMRNPRKPRSQQNQKWKWSIELNSSSLRLVLMGRPKITRRSRS